MHKCNEYSNKQNITKRTLSDNECTFNGTIIAPMQQSKHFCDELI